MWMTLRPYGALKLGGEENDMPTFRGCNISEANIAYFAGLVGAECL